MALAAVVVKQSRKITRPLKVLIPLIQQDLEDGDRAGMHAYADAGDKLLEAKDQVAHGHWGSWLSKNFALASTTARGYMRLARLREENTQNGGGAAVLPRSLRELEGRPKRDRARRKADRAYRSVLRELEADLYSQEEQTRDDEIDLHREIAKELIDVGFKALATRLHPDHGGSKEAFTRLTRVRVELTKIAKTRRFV
jgi:Protein of unknown function (DUF3102)